MTIAELVAEMKADPELAVAFEPAAATGSGSGGSGQQGGRQNDGGQGKTISRMDSKALSANIEDIASGKVKVGM